LFIDGREVGSELIEFRQVGMRKVTEEYRARTRID